MCSCVGANTPLKKHSRGFLRWSHFTAQSYLPCVGASFPFIAPSPYPHNIHRQAPRESLRSALDPSPQSSLAAWPRPPPLVLVMSPARQLTQSLSPTPQGTAPKDCPQGQTGFLHRICSTISLMTGPRPRRQGGLYFCL